VGEISAVLLMAYGSPNSLEEVAPYYREIRGGRTPTDQQVQELTERYRSVGGSTPLLAITREVAVNLEQRLGEGGDSGYRVYVGMKHWHPFISEAIQQIAADGVGRLIGVPLAPHYSRMSIDGYRAAVEEAIHTLPTTMQLRFIESWHENPLFIGAVAEKVRKALGGFPTEDGADVEVVFTAHSLPRSIRQWDDPYPRELLQSCEAVAAEAGVASWRFAYQSASHTGQPWLGPDILESLATLAAEGKNQVLVVPIGFVSDNLEIVFDLDVEAQELAGGLDMYLRRAEMLNASQAFIEALADLVVNGTGARLADLTNKA
jgi:ferrochelatase